jgi:HAD superfamily hydrolase (TIGR01549 family)
VTIVPVRRPAAVTFDFWDTLVRAPTAVETRHARRGRLRAVLAELGVEVDESRLDASLAAIRRDFDRHWAANRQFRGDEATDQLLRDLRADLSAVDRRRAADAFMGVGDDHLPELTRNVEETLRALEARGVRIGIICDVGLSPSSVLRSYLDRHGVLDAFDHWSFSDEVGVYKPDPRIFDHALTGLGGIAPSASAHVGDLRRTDIAGARAFGMTAVRYAGSNDDRMPDGPPPGEGDASMAVSVADAPEGDVVIHDHAELLGALGFA